ncbi:UvrD-helicase domain-containing protein [Egicoccus sp. AB-alg2]|uniref:UvrD-helicase domain-containing protein n=1 Tax=Egicoccus sp. AB-alg2 TaxID=3242693 RepID=UPI00359F0F2F
MSADPRLLEGLNPAQRDAVETVDGPVLVVAGAGSGKTRVLTHRIAHLIRDRHVSPFELLAITFTNKAAGEMAQRVGGLVGDRLSDRMWVTTFHKSCVRILRRELTRLGYRSGFTIYDAQDSQRLIGQIAKDLGVDDKRLSPRAIQHAISNAKDELVDHETYASRAGAWPEIQIADVYKAYQDRLLRANALDFDDLIVKTVEIFQLFDPVLEHWQQRFQYLMVDEYQDTNRAQYHLVNLLAAANRNIMVVGDHDQCLVPGTPISTIRGPVPVEEVQEGDVVLGTGGTHEAVARPVTKVMQGSYLGPVWRVHVGGQLLVGTPHHMVLARFTNDLHDRHLVYLMYRADRGYRIGRTKAVRPATSKQVEVGLRVRVNQERADAAWVLKVCDDVGEATFWESYFAAEYGLPTMCFHSEGRNLSISDERLAELFGRVDTERRAKDLMADLCLHPDFPHYRPGGGRRRQTVNVVMYQDHRYGEVGMHRVTWGSNRQEMADRLRAAGHRVRDNGKGGWKIETSRKSYEAALTLARQIAADGGIDVVRRAQIDGVRWPVVPLSHVHPGMKVLLEREEEFVEATVDHVDVGFHDGPVYDLEVADTHTYVANSMLVHNSIYAFRGATVQNLLDFERDYPDATVIPLVQNYRSTQTILDAANAVIRNNASRYPKDLWTDQGLGEPVVRYHADDEHDEAAFVAEELEKLRAEGFTFDDAAVFYRTNAQSRVLEDVFIRVGIPYRVIGGVRFYERKEIKDVLAYARLLVNPDDDVSARRVVNTPRRGVGDRTVEAVDWHARREGISFLEACRQAEHVQGLATRAIGAVTSFVDLLDGLRTALEHDLAVPDLIEEIWNRTGYLRELQAERTVEALGREENLRELKSVATEVHERGGGSDPSRPGHGATGIAGLETFLESVTLVSDQDELEDAEDGTVTLMTLHTAKGLEFPVVFLVGMEDGVFPHVRSLDDTAELEEERRLCYVGLTRAQQRLYVTHADHRTLWGGTSYNPPSRFLDELPGNLVERRGATRATSAASRRRDKELLEVAGEEFRPGDRVLHTKFGPGTIASLTGEGERAEATVDFDKAGRKHLMLAYAPLVKT